MIFTEYITHFLLRVLSMIFSLVPRRFALLLGRNIGLILYLLPFRKKVAKKNLDIVFKTKNKIEKRMVLLNCYKHYGMVLADFLSQRSINKYNMDDYFVFNKKDKKKLLEAQGGCILSAHIGNWEMVLPAMGLNNIKMDTVVMRQKNAAANNFYLNLRNFENINLIYKDGALKSLYKSITERRMIGLASDQNARKGGLKINFFGEPASFPKGAGKFYHKTLCSLFIVYCILRSDFKYHVYVKEIKLDQIDNIEDQVIDKIIRIYADDLSSKIQQHPEQYFWFHKKWNKKIYKA